MLKRVMTNHKAIATLTNALNYDVVNGGVNCLKQDTTKNLLDEA